MEKTTEQAPSKPGIFKLLGTVIKYSAYIVLAIQCLQMFMEKAQELQSQNKA